MYPPPHNRTRASPSMPFQMREGRCFGCTKGKRFGCTKRKRFGCTRGKERTATFGGDEGGRRDPKEVLARVAAHRAPRMAISSAFHTRRHIMQLALLSIDIMQLALLSTGDERLLLSLSNATPAALTSAPALPLLSAPLPPHAPPHSALAGPPSLCATPHLLLPNTPPTHRFAYISASRMSAIVSFPTAPIPFFSAPRSPSPPSRPAPSPHRPLPAPPPTVIPRSRRIRCSH